MSLGEDYSECYDGEGKGGCKFKEESSDFSSESPLDPSHQYLLSVVENCLSPTPGRGEGVLLIGLTSLPPPPANDHSLESSSKEVVVHVAPSPGDEALLVKMIQQETTPHQSYPTQALLFYQP